MDRSSQVPEHDGAVLGCLLGQKANCVITVITIIKPHTGAQVREARPRISWLAERARVVRVVPCSLAWCVDE